MPFEFRPRNDVFPAHAGMSLLDGTIYGPERSFPRTRGDEPYAIQDRDSGVMFSPHTRG